VSEDSAGADEPQRVVIRDKRRIDPVTGTARSGADDQGLVGAADPAVEPDQPLMVEAVLLDERTADLQRVQAEYANYRKRSDRERSAAEGVGASRTLAALLPVLDDIQRAKEHGDLAGPFETVAVKLDRALAMLGLEPFGEVGDPFDPAIHEAVLHDVSDAVQVPTCTSVLRPGYRYGERLLRPAMVGVSDPGGAVAGHSDEPLDTTAAGAQDDPSAVDDDVDITVDEHESPDATD
jgi:molecular chaperone GrpE